VGWVEQDAGQWWEAARAAIQAAASAASGARVVGICVGGQGPSIVPVDDRGRPLANALIWMDRRTEPERRALGEAVGLRPVLIVDVLGVIVAALAVTLSPVRRLR